MIACVCGFEAVTEGDLMSHVLDRHLRSYGLEACYELVNGDSGFSSIRNDAPAATVLSVDRN